MKIKITLKDPDGVWECIKEFAESQYPMPEQRTLRENLQSQISIALSPWIRCGEYVTIKFDTDAATATVMPQ